MGYIGKITDTAGSTHLVGSTLYGTCSTATATAAKVVTCSNYVEEIEGVTIHVHFTNKNTAGCTLNVNGKGAHTCVGCDGIPGSWEDDSVASFTLVKDGNTFYWYQNNLYWEGGSDTKVTQTATTTDSDYPILFKNSANQTAETDRVRYGNTTNKIPKINPSTGTISAYNLEASNEINGLQIEVAANGSFSFVQGDANGGFLEVPAGAEYTLGGACTRGIDTSVPSGSTSTNVPTTAAVAAAIDQATGGAAGALVYKGTAAALTDITGTSYEKGWYWIASAAFSWTGPNSTTVTVEPGDMIIAHQAKTATVGNDLDAIQTNIETLTTTEVSNLWTAAVAVS